MDLGVWVILFRNNTIQKTTLSTCTYLSLCYGAVHTVSGKQANLFNTTLDFLHRRQFKLQNAICGLAFLQL